MLVPKAHHAVATLPSLALVEPFVHTFVVTVYVEIKRHPNEVPHCDVSLIAAERRR
jgi:hypothetical protein